MITILPDQEKLASRDSSMMVALVKLDTFTNHVTKAIDETFYWASVPLEYQWDGLSTSRFRGSVKSVSPIVRGFPHIPSADVLTTRDATEVVLDASEWGDEFPWVRLTSKNLIGAEIEVASMFLDLGSPVPGNWQDQSALGAVHVVRFRGEVTDVSEYDDESNEFSLTCESMDPVLDWPEALEQTEVSQKDLGKLYPIPVGDAKRIPLVQRTVGWVTTLVSALEEATTGTVTVTDTAGFPDSPTLFGFMIGTERITATKVDSQRISIVTRAAAVGIETFTAQNHNPGAVIIEEIPNAKFVYSGVENFGLLDLYARSPHTGELVLIPASFYGFQQSDKELDPGHALGVVAITNQMWSQLIAYLNNEASITVQPAVGASGAEPVHVPFGAYTTATGISGAVNSGISVGPDTEGVAIRHDTTAPNTDGIVLWNATASVPSQSRVVTRFRPVFRLRTEGDGSNVTLVKYQFGGSPFGVTKGSTTLRSYGPGSPATVYESVAGAWETPAGGTTMADLVNASGTPSTAGDRIYVYLDQTAGGGAGATEVSVIVAGSYWEVELEPLPVSVTQNTETTGAQEYGFNLDLFGDVRGAVTIGSESSEGEMDQSAGWSNVGVTFTDIGGGGGFNAISSATLVEKISSIVGISPAIDFSGGRFKMDYQMDLTTWGNLELSDRAIQIQLLSAGGSVTWGWSRASLYINTWVELTFDPLGSNPQIIAVSGTIDLANITGIALYWRTNNAADAGTISYRDLRIEGRTFHQHPIDVAEWLIEENAGQTNGADTGTFATAKTNLPSVVMGGDLRNAGSSFGSVLARIGRECRTNFVPYEDSSKTEYKAFNALDTYAFAAINGTLSDFRSLKAKPKTLSEQATEFIGVYDYRGELSSGDVEGFRALIQANASTNDLSADVPTVDITDAQARVGVRPSDPLAFIFLSDLASMTEVFAYYVQEDLRGDALRFSVRVPHSGAYRIEPGDRFNILPRWSTTPIKCRVISVSFPFDEPSIGLNLEEVL